MSDKQSSIPEFRVPEFKPLIPEYMIEDIKDDSTRYIIEQLSIMNQQGTWQTHKIMNIHNYTKNINGKVIGLEQFRNDMIHQSKVDHERNKERKKNKKEFDRDSKSRKKYYKLAFIVFILILYPVYLAFIDTNGIGGVIKSLFSFM